LNSLLKLLTWSGNNSPNFSIRNGEKNVVQMIEEAVDCETQFSQDLLSGGVRPLRPRHEAVLEYVADSRLARLGMKPVYGAKNPFSFMNFRMYGTHELLRTQGFCLSSGGAGEVAFHNEF